VDKTLLDTDIYSEILKGRNPAVAVHATEYRSTFGRLAISVIAVMEVVKGLHKVGREDRLLQFLAALHAVEVLPCDTDAAILAGHIYADLERTGQPVGRADPLVAAIALRHGLVLATGNRNHFKRIQDLGYDLRLNDWRQ
jgi:tRNA(fMet)-specific endonuclease VapC